MSLKDQETEARNVDGYNNKMFYSKDVEDFIKRVKRAIEDRIQYIEQPNRPRKTWNREHSAILDIIDKEFGKVIICQ